MTNNSAKLAMLAVIPPGRIMIALAATDRPPDLTSRPEGSRRERSFQPPKRALSPMRMTPVVSFRSTNAGGNPTNIGVKLIRDVPKSQ
jgi:hypothetical protein